MAGNLHPATTPYHGVGRGLLEAVFAESKRFFSLPMEEKMELLR
jgi:isopenicillin N synthase-like dioxygenase